MDENTTVSDNSGADSATGGTDNSFDVETASNDLAGDLFPSSDHQNDDIQATDTDDTQRETSDPVEQTAEPVEQIHTKPAPKQWPKEMHEHWSKLPADLQEYWEGREKQMLDGLEQYKNDAGFAKQVKDIINPHLPRIQAMGIDAPRAIQTLLQADYMLSTSPPSQRNEYFKSLAKQYGVDLSQIGALQDETQGMQSAHDPAIVQLQDELHNIKSTLTSQTEYAANAERNRIGSEISTFASDPAHLYFDEVADDMIVMLKSGESLQDAYDKAVWANPVTRQKELSRIQTESETSAKEKARAEAEAARKASSVNIRNRDTQRTPTEKSRATMGNLDGALRETMAEIKSKVH